MKNIRTVGDLRKLVASLDAEGVPDDFPIARRADQGDAWISGFDQAGEITLVVIGRGATMTVEAHDAVIENNFVAVPPFKALAFD